MSFWPRLRRRSRGRKRSGKLNPYATRDIDKYSAVHAEIEAQRAEFAAEKGVPVSVVRYISRSSRGWVYLPNDSSVVNRGSSSDPDDLISPSEQPKEFALPPPALPLPATGVVKENISSDSGEGEQDSPVSVISAVDGKAPRVHVGRVAFLRKDLAWMQIRKSAGVFFVNVRLSGILTKGLSLDANQEERRSVFCECVGVFSSCRCKQSISLHHRGCTRTDIFRSIFSELTTQLLTCLRLHLSLLQAKSVPVIRPVSFSSSTLVTEMKVLPVTESSGSTDSEDLRSSSFAFPVMLTRDSSVASPLFPNPGATLASASSEEKTPADTLTVKVVSPLVESNKLPGPKSCQKLRSKLFKSSPVRKADSENSSPPPAAALVEDAESKIQASSSAPSSPYVGGKKTSHSFCKRNTNKAKEVGAQGENRKSDDELEPASKPKATRSHELLFFRSPNRREESTIGSGSATIRKNVSRSQELRFSFKSFAKKRGFRSQELTSSPSTPRRMQEGLPSSTVESLQSLAFPFREEEKKSLTTSSIQLQSPNASPNNSKDHHISRRNTLGKLISLDSSEEQITSRRPSVELPSSSPRGMKASKGNACKFSCVMDKATVAELKPGLRQVRTAVVRPSQSEVQVSELRKMKMAMSGRTTPLPTATGELGRSSVLSREILGSLLLLAVLGLLLLGRIPAILGTACFCLVLSHVQGFFARNLTPKDKELLKRASTIMSRQGNTEWSNCGGSPLYEKSPDFNSSEYRKRVLIEGLLDRGNRRGTP